LDLRLTIADCGAGFARFFNPQSEITSRKSVVPYQVQSVCG
jgi:hypothetical protein